MTKIIVTRQRRVPPYQIYILFDIRIRNVEKSLLKVRHEYITKMKKTKSTMTPLDMNLRIQIT